MSGIAHTFERVVHSNVGKGILAAVAAYYVSGVASGSFDSSSADGVAPGGGDESAGLSMNPGDTSIGANATNEAGGGLDMGGTVPDASTSPPIPDMPEQLAGPGSGYTPTADTGAPAGPAPQAAAQPAPSAPVVAPGSPDTATGAPQGNAGLPPVTDRSTPAPSSALSNLGGDRLTATSNWFKSLSPAAQAALMGGVAGGAGALMTALSQKHAQEFQLEHEQRGREDIQRRGQIPAFSSTAITPNSGGIINMARGGK